MKTRFAIRTGLLAGDALAAFIITLVGFLTHYGAVRDWKWITTFFPVLAAWLAVAPWMGLYDPARFVRPGHAWRAAAAAAIAAPLAATLRGLWLGGVVTPIFVLVLAANSALGFLIWRWLWAQIARRSLAAGQVENHG